MIFGTVRAIKAGKSSTRDLHIFTKIGRPGVVRVNAQCPVGADFDAVRQNVRVVVAVIPVVGI